MTPSYVLADVDLRRLEDPEHFLTPSIEARRRLKKGMLAKIIFELPPDAVKQGSGVSGERMWVEIDQVLGEGEDRRYRGTLKNTPVLLHGALRHGDAVSFGPQHVADVDRPSAAAR
jgi:hypothetical protein